MKKLIYILLTVIVLPIFIFSCEDVANYLDKPPGVDVTEDTIFSSITQIETFVAGTYYFGVIGDLGYWDGRDKSDCGTTAATDECEVVPSWFWVQYSWNTATMSSTDTGDRRFKTNWEAIRRANILLERIDDAPVSPDYIKQVRGEAKFIRALNYFDLFRKYSGVSIVKKRLNASDDLNIPRSSVKEVIDFIVEDCNDAINDLPSFNEYTGNQRGRACKAAAMALKSRTLLFAASKSYNTDKPYLSLSQHNELICYGNYDRERWKLAVDAARELIEEAKISGLRLIDEYGVNANYQYVWEHPDNDEVILAEKAKGTMAHDHHPWNYYIPESWMGHTPTHNFVKLYERKDGTPQSWVEGRGSGLMDIYANMDPRFAQTIAYHGQYFNQDYPKLDLSVGGRENNRTGGCDGGYVHKPVPYIVSSVAGAPPNPIIFRLGEAYLNLAEALNEYENTPPEEAYAAVDLIRKRSGMPALPRGLSKAEFSKRVRNERAIELAHEGHRLYDIRRWEIADDGIMKGNMYGLHIYKIPGSDECDYEPYVFEVRTFKAPMYRNPFPQTEINKGYLIQNPGY